jgi:hypothetical protein
MTESKPKTNHNAEDGTTPKARVVTVRRKPGPPCGHPLVRAGNGMRCGASTAPTKKAS